MRTSPQLFVLTYHKVGTVLMGKVLLRIAKALRLTMAQKPGLANDATRDADIVMFPHALIGFDLDRRFFRGVRLIRDPRDVWVSGYLYHRRCSEDWCINKDLTPETPLRYPKVPRSQEHLPDAWKQAYLDSLGGRSYQENLLALDQKEGLRFELDRYAGWTIKAMAAWKPHPAVFDLPIEAFADDYDAAMTAVFERLGLSGDRLQLALSIAAKEDISRMNDQQIEANPHIHSRSLSKWRTFLSDNDLAYYEARFAGVAEALGYRD